MFQYKRLRLLDGEPVMIERTTMIEPVGRLLLDCDLDGGSVYAQLGERGVEFGEADQTIAAIAAGAEDAALLAIRRRAPLLEVRRRGLDPRWPAARVVIRPLPRRRVRDHDSQPGRAAALGRRASRRDPESCGRGRLTVASTSSSTSGASPSAVVMPTPETTSTTRTPGSGAVIMNGPPGA